MNRFSGDKIKTWTIAVVVAFVIVMIIYKAFF